MKHIPVEQSIGIMLAHDMTEIIPGNINALLKVNYMALLEINDTDEIMISTLHTDQLIDVIQLLTEEELCL
jgi:hypothetical protein